MLGMCSRTMSALVWMNNDNFMLKEELNKWQFVFRFSRNPAMMCGFHPYTFIALVNIHLFPEPGQVFSRGENYRGFIWQYRLDFWRHWVWIERTIVIPNNSFTRWLHRRGVVGYQIYMITYPIKFIKKK